MSQIIKVNNYGEVTFKFPKTLDEVLHTITMVEEEEVYSTVLYTDEKATEKGKKDELDELRKLVNQLYRDCSPLAEEKEIDKYNKKKNGKFKKGAVAYFLTVEHATCYNTEFTNSWETFTIYGKTINENEIEIHMELRYLQN